MGVKKEEEKEKLLSKGRAEMKCLLACGGCALAHGFVSRLTFKSQH